jgi:hypothetical protein
MPLSTHQIQVLRNICNVAPAGTTRTIMLPRPAVECACWRWAVSGLTTPVVHDPAQAFNYIATGIEPSQGSAWRGQQLAAVLRANRDIYREYLRRNFQPLNGNTYAVWFRSVVWGVVGSICRGVGLAPAAGPFLQNNGARYYVCVRYDPLDAQGAPNPPNYTHWWLRIEVGGGRFVCLEMFPQSNALTFRFNHAHAVNNVLTMEVTNLAPNHMAVFNHVIPNPAPVPMTQ